MMDELTLIELSKQGNQFLTDKEIGHHYLGYYEKLFIPFRHHEINLFEVGYWCGGSCELWKRYFSKAHIRSIDVCEPKGVIVGSTVISRFIPPTDRVQLDMLDVNHLTTEYFDDFIPNIAIDDGSHVLEDQLRFVRVIHPILAEGGILIIEDVQNYNDKVKQAFASLDMAFSVIDNRALSGLPDSVLIVYEK